jgi:hypothetical protein
MDGEIVAFRGESEGDAAPKTAAGSGDKDDGIAHGRKGCRNGAGIASAENAFISTKTTLFSS